MSDDLEMVRVRGTRKDNRMVLWEVDERHPDGECSIYGDRVVEVARTPRVNRLIRDNQVEIVADAQSAGGRRAARRMDTATEPAPATTG